ncbi:MAG: hypothetical protein KGL95_13030 [Patescibacteria group bacterium]|nr:hypothetical protein [Patescibacteria group bacterium]
MFQINKIKPIISNVICTADLHQKVDLKKFLNFRWGIYDSEIYGGRCGYVKSIDMVGKVTVFLSGKMISLGTKSVKSAILQLNLAKSHLIKAKLISNTKLEPKVQNIVATLTLDHRIKINELAKNLNGAIYEPEQFPAIILRTIESTSYLIFSTGKIVISGAKSEDEIAQASFEIQQKLSSAIS